MNMKKNQAESHKKYKLKKLKVKIADRMIAFYALSLFLVTVLMVGNIYYISIENVHRKTGTDLKAYINQSITKTIQASRGVIYGADGYVIAEDIITYNIIAILDKDRISNGKDIDYVDDIHLAANVLSDELSMDRSEVLTLLSKDVYQTEFGNNGRNLTKEEKESIESHGLNGIEFVENVKRSYPQKVFASNLIGYAQAPDGEMSGKMGIEKAFDEVLTGEDGYETFQADKYGYTLEGMTSITKEAVDGADIYLTLEQEIQQALEDAFVETVAEFDATKVWGAVTEIETGKVLGWGQAPSFDGNILDIEDYTNYGLDLTFEPGSTMKSFLYAAAIESGEYDETIHIDSGKYCYGSGDYRMPYRVPSSDKRKVGCVTNAGKKDFGYITYDMGLIKSSNVLTSSLLSSVITPDEYEKYLDEFGFFSMVPTDIVNSEGIKNAYWASEKLALGYGQGSTVTTIQMLQGYSAILNGGEMVAPYFIDKIVDSNTEETIYIGEGEKTGNPISKSTSDYMIRLLGDVVNHPEGTARHYKVDGVEILGKTGTTQVASTDGSGYNTGETIASIMLAMPADDPKYIVYYAFQADYDRNAHYKTDAVQGLITAVATSKNLISYDEDDDNVIGGDNEKILIDDFVGSSVEDTRISLKTLGANLIILGDGAKVVSQLPIAGQIYSSGQKVFVKTESEVSIVPDFTGWTIKDITSYSQLSGFDIETIGTGVASSQNIPAGGIFDSETIMYIELE